MGESARPLKFRIDEHRRGATTPDSYPNSAFAIHYKEVHKCATPSLSVDILKTGLVKTVQRKVTEAIFIKQLAPHINRKRECEDAFCFLVPSLTDK